MPKVNYCRSWEEKFGSEARKIVAGKLAENNTSYTELAELIGISRVTLSSYKMDGFRKMKLSHFTKMTKALNFSKEDYDTLFRILIARNV